jgi:hypothetical protein
MSRRRLLFDHPRNSSGAQIQFPGNLSYRSAVPPQTFELGHRPGIMLGTWRPPTRPWALPRCRPAIVRSLKRTRSWRDLRSGAIALLVLGTTGKSARPPLLGLATGYHGMTHTRVCLYATPPPWSPPWHLQIGSIASGPRTNIRVDPSNAIRPDCRHSHQRSLNIPKIRAGNYTTCLLFQQGLEVSERSHYSI